MLGWKLEGAENQAAGNAVDKSGAAGKQHGGTVLDERLSGAEAEAAITTGDEDHTPLERAVRGSWPPE